MTAIVVARSGSKRLPGKALLPFAGSTLVGHKVQTLKACEGVSNVVIGSDCPRILAEGERYGAIPLKRDAQFCDEVSRTANDMIEDVVSRITGDVILWAHPTNPLVRASTYAAALAAFNVRFPVADSLLSVYSMKRHAWWHGAPFNHQPWSGSHQVGAWLEPVKFQDGAIFIQPRLQMVRNRSFYGASPFLFEMDPLESTDIDTPADYACAKALYSEFFACP